jgi:hypothetical protein
MSTPRMLRRVALVRTDVSKEHSASIIRVTGIGELGATLGVTSNCRILLTYATYIVYINSITWQRVSVASYC